MSRLRRVTLGTIAWVLVVLTCATGVWFVIDRVGRTVLSPAPVARGARATGTAGELPTGDRGTAHRTETPTTTTPATSPNAVTAPAAPTSTPSVRAPALTKPAPRLAPTHPTLLPPPPLPPPGPSKLPTFTPSSSLSPPSPPRPPSPPSPPASTSDAVAVAGGRVGAACTGSQISLSFATPESGWSFTVEAEPEHVAVHFLATSGTGQTDVSARCADGAPIFDTAETGNGSEGGAAVRP